MTKILALDVGEKTIGVALSDEGRKYAFPGKTLWRHPDGLKRDLAALRDLVAENGVGEIVVGLPLLPDGSPGIQVEKVEAFVAQLRNSVRIPIRYEDETLTTFEAEQALDATGMRRARQKKTIDSVAATLILESYLSRKLARTDDAPPTQPAEQEPTAS